MKRTLVAQSAAALIGGFVLAGAHAAVVGPLQASNPTTNSGVPAATKLEINTDGIGHILVVPYYSAQNGNATLLNIVNTDTYNAKAVKVRFRGASNSDDVFDFTLLLSPGDIWAGAVSQSASGVAKLEVPGDNSCTLPNGVGKGTDAKKNFVTARLNPNLTPVEQQSETREGYIEILNMADIPVNAATSSLYASIKHGTNGQPLNCNSAAVNALFNDATTYPDALSKGLEVPTSGLMANWTIINGPTSQAWSGAAVAVEARTLDGLSPGHGNIVLFPQSGTGVAVATARALTSDPLLRGGITAANIAASIALPDGTPAFPTAALAGVDAAFYDFPDLSTPYLKADLTDAVGGGTLQSANGARARAQAHRLTTALATTSITNEFVTDQSILAKTDWVFSLPTRRYNVARFYGATINGTTYPATTVFTNLANDDADAAVTYTLQSAAYTTSPPPAVLQAAQTTTVTALNFFTDANTASNTTAGKTHQICVAGLSYKGGTPTAPTTATIDLANRKLATTSNREESFAATQNEFVISPSQPTPGLAFCGEVSVLTFNAGAFTAGAVQAMVAGQDVIPSYADGWMRIATPGLNSQGLPVTGSAFMKYTNGAVAAGVMANYGVAFPHRATRY